MLFKKTEHEINLLSEFQPVHQSEIVIANLSNYISSLIKYGDSIFVDIQVVPAGYRFKAKIKYTTSFFRHRRYTKELSNLSDWFGNDKDYSNCLSRYYYTCV